MKIKKKQTIHQTHNLFSLFISSFIFFPFTFFHFLGGMRGEIIHVETGN